jgi:hypothetical protein
MARFENGHVTHSVRTEWIFDLVPEKPGKLEIGPFRLNCAGAEIKSRAITVPVRASTLPSDSVSLQVKAPTGDLWQGQTFQVDLTATLDAHLIDDGKISQNGLELDLPWFSGVANQLLKLDTPDPQADQQLAVRLAGTNGAVTLVAKRMTIDGKPRWIFTRSFLMLVTGPGDVQLAGSRFSATVATQFERDTDPVAALLNGNRLRVVRWATVDARADGTTLHVRTPPPDGRPASWVDAVGRFTFTGSADPTTLKVGETCTLTLTVAGDGNIDFLKWPAFDQLQQDFRIFGKTPRKLPRTQVLEIQISPKTERVTQVPALAFSWFDPDVGKYEEKTVGPYALHVQPGGSDGLATLETPDETLSSLITVRETLPEPATAPPPAWVLALPGLALLGAVELLVRRRRWRESNPAQVARRAARRRLAEALGAAHDARDVSVAFGKYLSARLDGPPAGLSADEACARLRDAELARELRGVVERWEAASFGRAALDVAAARNEAGRLADRVEAAT